MIYDKKYWYNVTTFGDGREYWHQYKPPLVVTMAFQYDINIGNIPSFTFPEAWYAVVTALKAK